MPVLASIRHLKLFEKAWTWLNRPVYSCVLSYLAMNASEAADDLALCFSHVNVN